MQRQQIQICLVVMDHTVLDLKYLEAIKGHKSPIYIQTLNSTKLGFIRKLQSRLINKIDPSSPSTPCELIHIQPLQQQQEPGFFFHSVISAGNEVTVLH
jgi:hypothetical protein